MAMIWRSHQVCESCGWAGTTRAHQLNIVSGLLYVTASIVLVLLDAIKVVDLKRIVTLPMVVFALFWFYGVPRILWQMNTCGACRQRMPVKLLSGRATHPAAAGDQDSPRS